MHFCRILTKHPSFSSTTGTLGEADLEQKGDEELVLRFFAAKNYRDNFKGNIRDWLDDYMELILLKKLDFES